MCLLRGTKCFLNATQIIVVFKGLIKHDAVVSFEGVEILGSVFAKIPGILPESFRDFTK